MNIKVSVFARLCVRCREIMLENGAPQVLGDIYQSASGQPLQRYIDRMKDVKRAQARANKAKLEKERLLGEMDGLFRTGRAAVAAVEPGSELPATLKAQATDTDRREAVAELVEAINEYAGQAWADNLLQGELGQKATETIQALDEYIAAWNALQRAKSERAAAFAPAWPAFLGFKRLVHATLGAASRQYQGLRLRNATSEDEEDATEEEDVEEDDVEGDEDEPTAPVSEPVPSAA